MKMCSFTVEGVQRVGLKTDGGVVDITALGFPANIMEVIESGEDIVARVSEALQKEELPLLCEQSVEFLPVSEPKKIICTGINYKDHAEETGTPLPEHPVFFNKFGDSLSAHGDPVALPPWLSCFDYEAELVIVIGKHAYNVPEEDAEGCIFGYTCGNDLTSRKAQSLTSQWLAGKALPGFAPVGPYIVTRDCFDPNGPNGIFCEVNGVTTQSAATSNMIYPCTKLVSAASKFFPLSPGDLIFTGTPAGVIAGWAKEDRVWLKPGDVVCVTIEGIGTLTTPLV